MMVPPSPPVRVPARRFPYVTALVIVGVVFACGIYANLAFAFRSPAFYRYLPPFLPINVNANHHLGGEYYQMAKALAAGEGFSHPFDLPTGPTAWQPPLLPGFLAALLWICDGSRDAVMAVVVFLQVYILAGTGILVVALARQTTLWLGPVLVGLLFLAVVLWNFRLCFQLTHDSWLVLLALDLLIAGLCWCGPLQSGRRAAAWGLFGGFCALVSPIVGFTWALLTLMEARRQRTWLRLAWLGLFTALALAPWTIRNYLVFGRFIPVKSNLAFELYQSQCLQQSGLLTRFFNHPFRTGNPEGRAYRELGEISYLDRKREQFWDSVRSDPLDFADRVSSRFLGATLWYVPFHDTEIQRPWLVWLRRVTHPLPFLALVTLVFASFWQPLTWNQWVVIGVYGFYLVPYIVASYYERYALPLLGVKVLLVVWAADRLLSLAAQRIAWGRARFAEPQLCGEGT